MKLQTKDIIFICDDNYCMPTIVSIQSIIDNGEITNSDVCIHVCTFGLSESNIALIKNAEKGGVRISIDLFDFNKYEHRITCIAQKSHVTPTALIKFELPYYYSQIDNVLYLDSDILVKGNLEELLNTDISGCYVAASYEFYCHLDRIRYSLHRSVSNDFYFNSGVMLMNLKKMREDTIPELLWDYKLNKAKTRLMDQESLNAVCGAKSIHLPIVWNFNPRFLSRKYLAEINKVYLTNFSSVDEIENDIKIIHYVGKPDKPWIYSTAHMREYWDIVYKRLKWSSSLNLLETKQTARSVFDSIHSKLTNYGLFGTFCFFIYTIQNKLFK